MPELELLQQDDRSCTLAERACRRDPGDPRPDDDDVRVGSHASHHRTALGTDAACEDRSVDVDLEALFRPGAAHASGWRRMPAVAAEAMIATSHPLASAAGLEAFRAGGNAVDAALAAAAVLTVAEPTDNGIGGDAFAIVWHDGALHGLNGSGRSPAVLDHSKVDVSGPRSVTVPGAVRAWADLAERFGRLGLERPVAQGVGACERQARPARPGSPTSGRAPRPAPFPAPRLGERYVIPGLAETLARIATEGPDALYTGSVGGRDRGRLVAR